MSQCESGWRSEILARHRRQESSYRGASKQIPQYLRSPDPESGVITGRTDFEQWASLPEISYSADPSSLYRLNALRRDLENSECFTQEMVAEQRKTKVQYPPSFYAGLVMAGVAIIYSMR